MSIFTTLRKEISSRIPFIRRPESQSQLDIFQNTYGSFLTYRNKNMGVGWNTYYNCMKNVWVNACIRTYIDEILNLGFTITDPNLEGVNIAHTSYFEKFFKNPMGVNSNYTYSTFEKLMWRSYLGLGDAFAEVIYDTDYQNVPIGMKYIPCEYMEYYSDTEQWGFKNDVHRFEDDEIIHIKEPNIYDGVWGESLIDVIAREINMEILAGGHTLDMLENGGLNPHGVIEYDREMRPQEIKQEQMRLQADAENGSEGLLLLKGGTYKNIGYSNRDMEYMELMDRIRDCIIATFGVPPAKVSIIETANLGSGSGDSQDKQFKKALKGKAKNFEDSYTKVIGRTGFKEVFKYNDLDIEDKYQRAQIEDIQIRNGSITINEVRNNYGWNKVSWGDEPINYKDNTENRDTDVLTNQHLNNLKDSLKKQGLIQY